MKTMTPKGIYIGQDNNEEVDVILTKKMCKDLTRLAKRAGITEIELLAQYLSDMNLAALAGIAERIRIDTMDDARGRKVFKRGAL